MSLESTVNTQGRPPLLNFDKLSFVSGMKNIGGKAYRRQAMELVSLSRRLVQSQEQSFIADATLRV